MSSVSECASPMKATKEEEAFDEALNSWGKSDKISEPRIAVGQ